MIVPQSSKFTLIHKPISKTFEPLKLSSLLYTLYISIHFIIFVSTFIKKNISSKLCTLSLSLLKIILVVSWFYFPSVCGLFRFIVVFESKNTDLFKVVFKGPVPGDMNIPIYV